MVICKKHFISFRGISGDKKLTFSLEFTDTEIVDIRYYFRDIVATLSSFLVLYPEASHIFVKQQLIYKLVQLYDVVLPKLYEVIFIYINIIF